MKRYLLPALCTLLLVACFTLKGQTQTAPNPQPAPKQVMWEYTVATISIDQAAQELNKFGANGWELVAITTVPTTPSAQTLYYFKRLK